MESFPSLNMVVNLNDITILDNSNINFSYKNCQLNSCTTNTTNNIAYTGSLRPANLKNFFRLSIPTISNSFISPDLKSQFNFVCADSEAEYCTQKDKILSCNNDYFWNLSALDIHSCSKQCTTNFPTYLYQQANSLANLTTENTNSGYCIGHCDSTTNGMITCPTGDLNISNYGSSLACTGPNYSRFSVFCLQKFTMNPITNFTPYTGSLLYSQAFNSPKIEINLSTALTEYHVEFWFNPDIVFLPKISVTGKYYIFWTNSISIKKDSKNYSGAVITDDYNVYNGASATAIIPTNAKKIDMKNGQWIKISYSVIRNGSNWDIFYYYKNDSDAGYTMTGLSINPTLSKIAFCTNNCASYFNDGGWYSGAYKFLKVWDAALTPVKFFRDMDR